MKKKFFKGAVSLLASSFLAFGVPASMNAGKIQGYVHKGICRTGSQEIIRKVRIVRI